MLIKVCGLRDVRSAEIAASSGADLLGFVLAPSKRRVETNDLADIASALRQGDSPAKAIPIVGVFVDEAPERIDEIARRVGLAYAQLSGDESVETAARIAVPVLKAISVGRVPGESALEAADRLSRRMESYGDTVRRFVLDSAPATSNGGARGGTGRLCDWSVAAILARRFPCLLAGGLRPENVEEAILAVSPMGVDVSSGVEYPDRPGVKDPSRIEAFSAGARRADARSVVIENIRK